jgi:hypothetical protein
VVSRRYALIGVEGNHDQAFLARILHKSLGFRKFDDGNDELDDLWRKFRPVYPPKSGKFYVRLNLPSILHTDDVSVAIYAGEGSSLIANLSARLSDLDISKLFAFGIVADSDKSLPTKVAEDYSSAFQEFFPNFPSSPGLVDSDDTSRSGVYVLPDNASSGVLETLLCKCGEAAYPEYMQRALSYINSFSEEEIRKLKWKPFDREKATIATIASVLRPGKTNTVSISDNDWVCHQTTQDISELFSITEFLKKLLL